MVSGQGHGALLLIEDDLDIQATITAVLSDEGYQVCVAENGRLALEKLEKLGTPPCMIILDIMMPEMDGHAFRVAQLRDPRFSAIPVVVLSADSKVEQKAADMQAAGWLAKPVHLDRLLAEIARHC